MRARKQRVFARCVRMEIDEMEQGAPVTEPPIAAALNGLPA